MTNPLIKIGDEVREMTDAEHAQWLLDNEEEPTDETPSPA
jgi:hypothetical protein